MRFCHSSAFAVSGIFNKNAIHTARPFQRELSAPARSITIALSFPFESGYTPRTVQVTV